MKLFETCNGKEYNYVEVEIDGKFEKKLEVGYLYNMSKILFVDCVEHLQALITGEYAVLHVGDNWRKVQMERCVWRVSKYPDGCTYRSPHSGHVYISEDFRFCPTCGMPIEEGEEC